MPCLAAQGQGVCALQCEQGNQGPANSTDPPDAFQALEKLLEQRISFLTVVLVMLLSSGIHVYFLLPSLSLSTLLLQQQQEIIKRLRQIPRNKPGRSSWCSDSTSVHLGFLQTAELLLTYSVLSIWGTKPQGEQWRKGKPKHGKTWTEPLKCFVFSFSLHSNSTVFCLTPLPPPLLSLVAGES